jgi:hypothetical protein
MDFAMAQGAQQDALVDLGTQAFPTSTVVGEREFFLAWIAMMKVKGCKATFVTTKLATATQIGDRFAFQLLTLVNATTRPTGVRIAPVPCGIGLATHLASANQLGPGDVELTCVVLPKGRAFEAKFP